MTGPQLTLRRWTRHEDERLVGLGVFQRDLVELIGGQLVVSSLKGAITRPPSALRTMR